MQKCCSSLAGGNGQTQWSNQGTQNAASIHSSETVFIRQRGRHCPRGQAQGRRNQGVRGQRGPLDFWSKPFSLKMDILLLLDWSPQIFWTSAFSEASSGWMPAEFVRTLKSPLPHPHRKKGFGHLLKNVAIVNHFHFSVSIGGYQKIKNKHFIHSFLCKEPGNKYYLTQKFL